jgi:hypothetical protein
MREKMGVTGVWCTGDEFVIVVAELDVDWNEYPMRDGKRVRRPLNRDKGELNRVQTTATFVPPPAIP